MKVRASVKKKKSECKIVRRKRDIVINRTRVASWTSIDSTYIFDEAVELLRF
jgi:ribosomal protein L36